jgi:hypothetical protein
MVSYLEVSVTRPPPSIRVIWPTTTVIQPDCLSNIKNSKRVTLRQEHRLRVFRTGCWGEYSDPRGRKWREAEEHCIMRSFITCTLHQMLLGACSMHWRDEMCTIFWSEGLKGRDHSEDLGVDGRMVLKLILGKQCGKVWTGFIWLRIGTSGGLSWTW